jgi:hypothetical protein
MQRSGMKSLTGAIAALALCFSPTMAHAATAAPAVVPTSRGFGIAPILLGLLGIAALAALIASGNDDSDSPDSPS